MALTDSAAVPRDGHASFARAFAAALRERKTSLSHVHRRLAALGSPVSMATLSYWRSGRSQPEGSSSLDAVSRIEEILGLRRRELLDALGPTRRRGPRQDQRGAAEVLGEGRPVDEVVAALGAGLFEDVDELTVHVTLDLGPHGAGGMLTFRSLLMARLDGVDRVPCMVASDDPVAEPPQFRAITGCRLGEVVRHANGLVHGVPLLFERSLRAGETIVIEYAVSLPPGAIDDNTYEHGVVRRVKELMVLVRFDPSRVPARVESFTVVDDFELAEPLPPNGASSAHLVLSGFGPGRAGIRWWWD